MRVDLGLQGLQFVTLVFNFRLVNLVNVQIEVAEHVVKRNGNINQLVFMLVVNGNIGV